MDERLTPAELQSLLQMLKLGPRELIRSKESLYKEQNLGDPSVSDQALIDAMAASPILIQRPIAVRGKRAILGRPPEKILELVQ